MMRKILRIQSVSHILTYYVCTTFILMNTSHVATLRIDSSAQVCATSYLCSFTVMEYEALLQVFSSHVCELSLYYCHGV